MPFDLPTPLADHEREKTAASTHLPASPVRAALHCLQAKRGAFAMAKHVLRISRDCLLLFPLDANMMDLIWKPNKTIRLVLLTWEFYCTLNLQFRSEQARTERPQIRKHPLFSLSILFAPIQTPVQAVSSGIRSPFLGLRTGRETRSTSSVNSCLQSPDATANANMPGKNLLGTDLTAWHVQRMTAGGLLFLLLSLLLSLLLQIVLLIL